MQMDKECKHLCTPVDVGAVQYHARININFHTICVDCIPLNRMRKVTMCEVEKARNAIQAYI